MTKHGGCPVVIGSKWITNKQEALSYFKGNFYFGEGRGFFQLTNLTKLTNSECVIQVGKESCPDVKTTLSKVITPDFINTIYDT